MKAYSITYTVLFEKVLLLLSKIDYEAADGNFSPPLALCLDSWVPPPHSDPPTSEILIVLSEEVDKCFGHKEKSLH